jgi:dienelactone hydrolase
MGVPFPAATPASRRRKCLLAATAAVMLVAAACAPPTPPLATGYNPNDAPQAGVAAYTEPGPYAAGVTTIDLADRKVEVWYPADPEAVGEAERDVYFIRSFIPPSFDALIPPAVNPPYVTAAYRDIPAATDGPFPLALFSHGAAGFRLTSTELTAHLATWGFVVISPDYLERGLTNALGSPPATPRADVVIAGEAINAVRAASDAAGLLEGTVADGPVFPFGHSAGGGTSLRLLQRPDVPVAIPIGSGISPLAIFNGTNPPLPPNKAVMWIAGRNDGISPVDNARNGYAYTAGEKKLIELRGGGHNNAFTELCEIGDGGVAALAIATGLPVPEALLNLGNDGCPVPPFRDSAELWPEVKHFITAEFRYRAGIDVPPVGLGNQVVGADGIDDVLVYRHAP